MQNQRNSAIEKMIALTGESGSKWHQRAEKQERHTLQRSRRAVGNAPTHPLPSRVSRKGLPCPEIHDTPMNPAEDSFLGFIEVGLHRQKIRRGRRRRIAENSM